MPITVQLHNADLDELIVTVTDLNLEGAPEIVHQVRLPEDQLLAIAVQERAEGSTTGDIHWAVARASDPATTAERTVEVEAIGTVDLSANFG